MARFLLFKGIIESSKVLRLLEQSNSDLIAAIHLVTRLARFGEVQLAEQKVHRVAQNVASSEKPHYVLPRQIFL